MLDLSLVPDTNTAGEDLKIEESDVSRRASNELLLDSVIEVQRKKGSILSGTARHTLGMFLLLLVVFLWTLSNFLESSIFADKTYAKPFFQIYLNTSMFMLTMIPNLLRAAYRQHKKGNFCQSYPWPFARRQKDIPLYATDCCVQPGPDTPMIDASHCDQEEPKYLGIIATARLSLTFCVFWFAANYFAMACLQYTTVASTTIFDSTSSFWTLLLGAFAGIEKFTWRKLCGVLGSFVGIILISRVDFSAKTGADAVEGVVARAIKPFPVKSASEMALGDALALFSAVVYGMYTVMLKKSTNKALPRSLEMSWFFGLVGAFNFVFLLPLFPVLDWSGLEKFELPPNGQIWTILLVNGVTSVSSDVCWAHAMMLTSPLVVTVGMSLTIPLSLLGEMVLQGRYEGWMYWVGAGIVVGSFLFVDSEGKREEIFEKEDSSSVSDEESFCDENQSEELYLTVPKEGIHDDSTGAYYDQRLGSYTYSQMRRRSSAGNV